MLRREQDAPSIDVSEAVGHRTIPPTVRRRSWPPIPVFAIADVAALAVAAAVAGLWGRHTAPLVGAVVIVLAVVSANTYRLRPRILQAAPAVFAVVTSGGLLAAALLPDADGMAALLWAVIAFPCVLLSRSVVLAATKLAGRSLRRSGCPALVVGTGPTAVALTNVLLERPEFGLDPIGFVDDGAEDPEQSLPMPVVGTPDDIERVTVGYGVRAIIVGFGVAREPELVRALRRLSDRRLDVYVMPRFFDLNASYAHDIHGYPLVRIRRASTATSRRLKRVFDVVGAALLLLVASPALAVIALGVRYSSPGPIIFRQERIGGGGRRFEVLKFRSMRENDDSDTTWSVDDDDRVTPIGRVLRTSHLDELPQLWNVLRGDMSLVGPRPERPTFADLFGSTIVGYEDRHRVPVGITGWAQVNGLWGDTSLEDRARLDNRYIEEWSLWKDVVILFRTVGTLFGR